MPGGGGEQAGADAWRRGLALCATALCVARPLLPSETAAAGEGLLFVLLWLLLAAAWLLDAASRGGAYRFCRVDALLAACLGWHALSGLWAVFHAAPRPAINMSWEWIGQGLVFFLWRQLAHTPRETRALVAAMASLALALALYGAYQHRVELPRTNAAFDADPEGVLRSAGLDLRPGTPEYVLFVARLRGSEPSATFGLPNSLAGFLVPWLMTAVGAAIVALQAKCAWRSRIAWGAIVAMALGCVVLTKSRTGFVAVLAGIGLLVAVLGRPRSKRAWMFVAAACAALVALLAGAFAANALDLLVVTEAGKSLAVRVEYWQATCALIADHWLVGCGPGNFQDRYTLYRSAQASEMPGDPHNFVLEAAATAGIPAAGLLLAFLVLALRATAGRVPAAPQPVKHGADVSAWMLAGSVAGWGLAYFVGLAASSLPLRSEALVAGMAVQATAVVALWNWVRDGELPAVALLAGCAGLLTNLCFAGGIGMPGVAGSLWIPLALALNASPRGGALREISRASALQLVASALALACFCYWSAHRPVSRCAARLAAARAATASNPRLAAELFVAATEADPLSSEAWLTLAEWDLETRQGSPSADTAAAYRDRISMALERRPFSAGLWAKAGEGYDSLHDVERSVEAYRQATALDPTRAVLRARLALALQERHNLPAAREQAHEALRLDDQMPHVEQKLPHVLRQACESLSK